MYALCVTTCLDRQAASTVRWWWSKKQKGQIYVSPLGLDLASPKPRDHVNNKNFKF